jgi:hypothetical protein
VLDRVQNLWMLVRNVLPTRTSAPQRRHAAVQDPVHAGADLATLRLIPPMLAAADHMEADEFDAAQHALEANRSCRAR